MKKLLSLLLLLSFTIKAQDVKIGRQTWTTKNLDVTKYRNGDVIPEVKDAAVWVNLTTGAWCYYENKAENGAKYGKLYNWYAVTDHRGLAPEGYHIPSNKEFSILSENLGEFSGTQMKSTSGWDEDANGTNTVGFDGLPGGVRWGLSFQDFSFVGNIGMWWSSSKYNTEDAWSRKLNTYSQYPTINNSTKQNGYSVRCVKD